MKSITCIVCPKSCSIACQQVAGQWTFSGNGCKRGAAYAQHELTCPMRTLSTTLRTTLPETPAIPVRTQGEIPKSLMQEVMTVLSRIVVDAPKHIGDVVVPNILNTGCDIICTAELRPFCY